MITLEGKGFTEKKRYRCQKKFLFYFPKGFKDPTYLEWERQYKWQAHLDFAAQLNEDDFSNLLSRREFATIASIAARIESRTNLLFSFEKMALRDAIRSQDGAKDFAMGLFDYLYGKQDLQNRFDLFVERIASLPRKQTRVLTWPLLTVFGFIGNPSEHIFLKPRVTKIAAEKYGFDFRYLSRPNWDSYKNLLEFAGQIKKDNADLRPKDFIDLQSFIWVMGSDEYPD